MLTISNGQVKIWNYETQTDLKTFEVTDVPVRCVRYIARKNWVRVSLLLPLYTPPKPSLCHLFPPPALLDLSPLASPRVY
jgi:hypothetical protein